MRYRQRIRRGLLKAVLATPVATLFPAIGITGNGGQVDRAAEQQHRAATRIKVVGVGGAGRHALERLIRTGFKDAELIVVDTENKSLFSLSAGTRILLAQDIVTGRKPKIVRDMAVEARSRIASALEGADIAFIVAGVGGRTRSGAAPIVAQVARDLGILTISLAYYPFLYEGRRSIVATAGTIELNRISDALILIPLESLSIEIKRGINAAAHGVSATTNGDESILAHFDYADRKVERAIRAIVDIVRGDALVSLGLDDLRSAITSGGICATGSAIAQGNDRARIATMGALYSPGMEVLFPGSRKFIVFNIAAGDQVGFREINTVFRTLRGNFSAEALILGGAVIDDDLQDRLRVTLIAGGMESWPPTHRS